MSTYKYFNPILETNTNSQNIYIRRVDGDVAIV